MICLPASRGLKISEFLTSTDPVAQTAELQAAIDAMLTSPRYFGLDLEGLLIYIDDTINLGSATQIFKSTIHNGRVKALSTFAGTGPNGKVMFDFSASSSIGMLRFHAVDIEGGPVASPPYVDGLVLLDNTQGVRFDQCKLERFAEYGIKDLNAGPACEVYVSLCEVTGGQFAGQTGIDFAGNDNHVIGSVIRECSVAGIRARSAAVEVSLNHFYNYYQDYAPFFRGDNPHSHKIIGNYIDGAWIDLYLTDNDPIGTIINDNRFLLQHATDAGWTAVPDRGLIELHPNANGRHCRQIEVMGNAAKCASGGPVKFMRARYASGSIDWNQVFGVKVKDNLFHNVTPTSSHPRAAVAVSGATTAAKNFSGEVPFNVGGARAINEAVLVGSGGPVKSVSFSGQTATVTLGSSSTGTVYLRANINNDGD